MRIETDYFVRIAKNGSAALFLREKFPNGLNTIREAIAQKEDEYIGDARRTLASMVLAIACVGDGIRRFANFYQSVDKITLNLDVASIGLEAIAGAFFIYKGINDIKRINFQRRNLANMEQAADKPVERLPR